MVVCPGGGYRIHAEHEGAPVAAWLNSIGIAALVLRYRLAPHRHPAGLEDLQQAVQSLRTSRGIDPTRVGALGFSAGGHLAALAATEQDSGPGAAVPDILVLGYPRISLLTGSESSVENLLGPGADPALRRELSIEHRVTAATPPTFAWHTMADEVVDVSHTQLLASTLHEHGVAAEVHLFPDGEHGLGLAADTPGTEQWTALCENWLRRQGWC